MRMTRQLLIALAAAFSIGAANADEPRAVEVVIVTAPRPLPIEIPDPLSNEALKPQIDYSNLKIEPPRLDPAAVEPEPVIELALSETAKSKS
jgi:hypothetical protein